MNRWCKAHPKRDDALPFALASETAHGFVLDAINRSAHDEGVKPGQKLTDARAICPPLQIEPSDHDGDAAWLTAIGHWARRWCPWTAVDGTDGLLLDITGAAHLFDGEAAMLADMHARCHVLGLAARIAAAPSIGAAWALARFSGDKTRRCQPDDLDAQLAPLPIDALRLDGDTALLLRRMGLKTIANLADIPPLSLARRFRKFEEPGRNPLHRLNQALGRIEEMVAPLVKDPAPRAAKRVLEPILHVAILKPVLLELAQRLCQQLEDRQSGVRRVRFEAFRVDGHVGALEAETASAVRDPAHIARLFDEKIDMLDAGFGFDSFALTALWHETMAARQTHLDEERYEGIALSHLVDRLCARIGAQNVSRPMPEASHIPERSISWQPALRMPAQDIAMPATTNRPLRLFDRPELITVLYAMPEGPPRRFQWRRCQHQVVKAEGPERIAPEWWRERSTVRLRDYYVIEDEDGRRFWIYRNGLADDGRGGVPDWYIHGLFA